MIDQSAQIQRLLTEAISAARAGDNKYARPLLRRVVSLDPQNEQAWLWLSQVEETPRLRMQALEHVLEINPGNTAAQRGLTLLREQAARPPAPRAPSAMPTSSEPAQGQRPVAAQLSPMEELRPMLEASRKRKGAFRPSEIVIFLIGIVLVWLVARVALDLLIPVVPAVPEAPLEPEGRIGPWQQIARSGLPLALPLLLGRQARQKAQAATMALRTAGSQLQSALGARLAGTTAPDLVLTQPLGASPGEPPAPIVVFSGSSTE